LLAVRRKLAITQRKAEVSNVIRRIRNTTHPML